MAEFSEELTFDISRALASIDRIEDALNRSATQFRSGLLSAIDDIRDVRIAVDTAGLSADITRAIDNAEGRPRIDPDTSRIRPAIDDAVPPDIDVDIDADATKARTEVAALGREADDTTDRLGKVKAVLAALAATGAAEAVRTVVDAFSALEEQTSGSEVAFGAAADEVQRFASQASGIGLAADEALRAANQFGLMAGSAGLASDAAAEFATTIVQRGADIASLRDLDLSETLDRLRSGLTGETEPLRDLGIFLNAAKVEAKAFELGLADASGEVSDAALIQARFALILDESSIAAGNFADTADGLANSQRKLQADFRNLLVVVGAEVAPAFADLVGEGRDLLPLLRDLAIGVLPPLVSIAGDLAPVLGSFLQILVALSPVVEVFADVIGAIPEDVITFAGGMILLNSAFAAFKIGAAVTAVQGFGAAIAGLAATRGVSSATAAVGVLRSSLTSVGTSLAAVNPLLAVGGLALGAFAFSALNAAKEKREFQREVREATEALRDEEGVLRTTTASLAEFFEAEFADRGQIDDIGRLGLSLAQVGDLAGQGAEGLRQFIDRAIASNEIDLVGNNTETVRSYEDLSRVLGLTEVQIRELLETGRTVGPAGDVVISGNKGLIDSFEERQKVVAATAQGELELIRLSGPAAAALVDQASANHLLADGSVDSLAALEQVNEAMADQQAAADRLASRFGPLIAGVQGLADANSTLGAEAPDALAAVGAAATNQTAPAFLAAAQAIDKAALSEEGFAAAAALLGTDVAGLTGFVDAATGALDDFATAAIGALPTVDRAFSAALASAKATAGATASEIRGAADAQIAELQRIASEGGAAFSDAQAQAIRDGADQQAAAVEDAAHLTAQGLTDTLNLMALDLQDFRGDLAHLADAGFADLAGLIAEQGPEVGGQLADELDEALASGNTAILEGLRTANTNFETESLATADFMRDTLGPRLIVESGLIAQALTANFGDNLDFEDRIRIATGLAESGLDEGGQAIAVIAAAEGESAAQAYGEAFDIEQSVIDEATAAGLALVDRGTTVGVSGGVATGAGFAEGVAGYGDAAAAALAFEFDARLRRDLKIFSPSGVAFDLGAFTGEGFALGLESKMPDLAAVTAIGSPSRTGAVLAAGSPAPPTGAFDDSRILAALAPIAAMAKPLIGSLTVGNASQVDSAMREVKAQAHLGGWG